MLHFSLEQGRFLPSSPLIAGSSQSYGRLWGEALGRTDLAALKLEIEKGDQKRVRTKMAF